jgi:hypothetical protein
MGGAVDVIEHLALSGKVGVPHLLVGDTEGIAQAEIVLAPSGNVPIKQGLKGRRGPRRRMHAIGDRIDRIVCEHVSGHFPMLFRDTVDVVAEIERQVGHVEDALATEHLWHGVKHGAGAKHAFHEFERKLIMPGGNRGMGGKHAVLTDDLDVVVSEGRPTRASGLLIEQFQGEQAGMPLIHMPAGEGRIAERPQHAHPPDPQQHFLAQPVVGITAVQHTGQRAVPGRVVWQISVQKIHRHSEATQAAYGVVPGAEVHGAPFDFDLDSCRHVVHKLIIL